VLARTVPHQCLGERVLNSWMGGRERETEREEEEEEEDEEGIKAPGLRDTSSKMSVNDVSILIKLLPQNRQLTNLARIYLTIYLSIAQCRDTC